jgi:hypothetical protein
VGLVEVGAELWVSFRVGVMTRVKVLDGAMLEVIGFEVRVSVNRYHNKALTHRNNICLP